MCIGLVTPSPLVVAFGDRTLPAERWTHEAHLEVCRFAVLTMGAAAALDHLREAIRAFNETTGVANTDSSGYHETLTRYYVGAVAAAISSAPDAAAADPATLDAVLADERCGREAPRRHWTPEALRSAAARRAWLPPDRAPLPW